MSFRGKSIQKPLSSLDLISERNWQNKRSNIHVRRVFWGPRSPARMRGSWKGLFYLKEGKKCIVILVQKSYQTGKNLHTLEEMNCKLVLNNALEIGMVKAHLYINLRFSVRNSKNFTNFHNFFRTRHLPFEGVMPSC